MLLAILDLQEVLHAMVTVCVRVFLATMAMQRLTRMSVFRMQTQPPAKALRAQRWQMEPVLRVCPWGLAQQCHVILTFSMPTTIWVMVARRVVLLSRMGRALSVRRARRAQPPHATMGSQEMTVVLRLNAAPRTVLLL